MRKFFLLFAFLFLQVNFLLISNNNEEESSSLSAISDCRRLYSEMKLEGIVNYKAFEQAIFGYKKIKNIEKDIITLVDFTKPSTEERLYVLDLKNKKVLFVSLVSHGKNSGGNYATSFSNVVGSYQSSLGFYLTENTYYGKNGYSLVLNGLERNINDKAKERAIVIHGAPYCDPSFIKSQGRLGRSFGCPALPENTARSIINTIKDGSVLFIYANNKNYLAQSKILSSYSQLALNE